MRAATNRRLRAKGFARSRGGYLPPGCSNEEIEKAAKFRKVLKKNRSVKPPPDPKIGISPLTPEGGVNVGFTEPMLAPKKGSTLQSKIYNNIMDIGVESQGDDSIFKGAFGQSKKMRLLAAAEVEGDAAKMAFVPVISDHNSTGYAVNVEFDNPEALSIGGSAKLSMEIKEVSVFKTLKTLKPMDSKSFDAGKPELGGGLPPIIADPEAAKELEDTSEGAASTIKSIMSSNFFLGLLLGGSMQELWGMIRALQMTSLSALINVKIPTHLHLYLAICVVFAQMDIFSGEDLYEKYLVFKATQPPSEQFAFFEIDSSNFMMNSGSYFVIQASLLVYYFVTYLINKACVYNARYSVARRIGILVYEENYWSGCVGATYKLFLESYFDIVMCVMLNGFAFIKSDDEWASFFATGDDALCSTITIVYAALIFFYPLMSWH